MNTFSFQDDRVALLGRLEAVEAETYENWKVPHQLP